MSKASIFFKVITGALFITSAVLKLQSIDSFELYIFSFNILSLELSSLLSRAVIGVEMALGIGYISNIYHRQFFWALATSLAAFTLFLIYLVVIGRQDNCHCFGELTDITPMESILKNGAMMLMLALSYKTPKWRWKVGYIAKLSLMALIAVCVVAPFIKYPPHSVYGSIIAQHAGVVERRINLDLFNSFIDEHPEIGWGTECKVLLFYGTECKYCQASAQQISHIVRRNGLDTSAVKVLFLGDEQRAQQFFEQANSVQLDFLVISPIEILGITRGKIPAVVLYDSQATHKISVRNMRSIEEQAIIELLKGE